jgi:hypothetical protein
MVVGVGAPIVSKSAITALAIHMMRHILFTSSSWCVIDLSFSRQSLKDRAEGINAEPYQVVIEGMV